MPLHTPNQKSTECSRQLERIIEHHTHCCKQGAVGTNRQEKKCMRWRFYDYTRIMYRYQIIQVFFYFPSSGHRPPHLTSSTHHIICSKRRPQQGERNNKKKKTHSTAHKNTIFTWRRLWSDPPASSRYLDNVPSQQRIPHLSKLLVLTKHVQFEHTAELHQSKFHLAVQVSVRCEFI